MRSIRILAAASFAALIITAVPAGRSDTLLAQQMRGSDPPHTLDLTWDRWLSHEEIGQRMELMARTWPRFLTFSSMGTSYGGR